MGERGPFLRKQAAISAVINAGFSLAFFLLVFGRPGRALALTAPDGLAFDFLPQSAAVGLMSAVVPVLVTRRELAGLRGRPPRSVRAVVLWGVGFALLSLAVGAVIAAFSLSIGPAHWPGWSAFVFKLVYGALLGAGVTTLALRPR